jgi:pimeloyl-ACP methyl ester carboxylesterase
LPPVVPTYQVHSGGRTQHRVRGPAIPAAQAVLLHGFPASSHQYRDLIPALATRFHVIAPDYPGFGNSDMPDPATFAYTFDRISEIIEAFLNDRGFDHYGLFVQDYGGPVGFRILTRHPKRSTG